MGAFVACRSVIAAQHDTTIDCAEMHDESQSHALDRSQHDRDSRGDADEWLSKWRGRWPEWRIAQSFIDPAHRMRAEAWFALLQEFTDAAWGGTDATPGLAKLGWWQDELHGWAKGARRHPLGIVLHPSQAPWSVLAANLAVLHAAREHVLNDDPTAIDSFAHLLRPFVEAADACERILFADGAADRHDRTVVDPNAGRILIASHTLWLSVDTPDAARRARALCAIWPRPATTRPRRIYDVLILKRLQAILAGGALRPLSPGSTLWVAWRAARG